MNTKRKSVDRRKTQKRKFRGKGVTNGGGRAAVAEKNEIFKEGTDATYIRPYKWSPWGFSGPKFVTKKGVEEIQIDGHTVFVFIKLNKKWYAMMSVHQGGLLGAMYNAVARVYSYELPDFKVADGIIANVGKGIPADNSEVFDRLMQIKNGVSVQYGVLGKLKK